MSAITSTNPVSTHTFQSTAPKVALVITALAVAILSAPIVIPAALPVAIVVGAGFLSVALVTLVASRFFNPPAKVLNPNLQAELRTAAEQLFARLPVDSVTTMLPPKEIESNLQVQSSEPEITYEHVSIPEQVRKDFARKDILVTDNQFHDYSKVGVDQRAQAFVNDLLAYCGEPAIVQHMSPFLHQGFANFILLTLLEVGGDTVRLNATTDFIPIINKANNQIEVTIVQGGSVQHMSDAQLEETQGIPLWNCVKMTFDINELREGNVKNVALNTYAIPKSVLYPKDTSYDSTTTPNARTIMRDFSRDFRKFKSKAKGEPAIANYRTQKVAGPLFGLNGGVEFVREHIPVPGTSDTTTLKVYVAQRELKHLTPGQLAQKLSRAEQKLINTWKTNNLNGEFDRLALDKLEDTNVAFYKKSQVKKVAPISFKPDEFLLPNGLIGERRSTYGDGSCGLHALLGAPNFLGVYIYKEAQDFRNRYADYVMNEFNEGRPLGAYDELFQDFFLNTGDIADRSLREEMTSLKANHKRDVDFAHDRLVWEAYFKHIKRMSFYLDQTELFAMASWALAEEGKKLILVQPGWGHDSNTLALDDGIRREGPGNHIASGPNDIYVYYDREAKHFERIEVVKT